MTADLWTAGTQGDFALEFGAVSTIIVVIFTGLNVLIRSEG